MATDVLEDRPTTEPAHNYPILSTKIEPDSQPDQLYQSSHRAKHFPPLHNISSAVNCQSSLVYMQPIMTNNNNALVFVVITAVATALSVSGVAILYFYILPSIRRRRLSRSAVDPPILLTNENLRILDSQNGHP